MLVVFISTLWAPTSPSTPQLPENSLASNTQNSSAQPAVIVFETSLRIVLTAVLPFGLAHTMFCWWRIYRLTSGSDVHHSPPPIAIPVPDVAASTQVVAVTSLQHSGHAVHRTVGLHDPSDDTVNRQDPFPLHVDPGVHSTTEDSNQHSTSPHIDDTETTIPGEVIQPDQPLQLGIVAADSDGAQVDDEPETIVHADAAAAEDDVSSLLMPSYVPGLQFCRRCTKLCPGNRHIAQRVGKAADHTSRTHFVDQITAMEAHRVITVGRFGAASAHLRRPDGRIFRVTADRSTYPSTSGVVHC